MTDTYHTSNSIVSTLPILITKIVKKKTTKKQSPYSNAKKVQIVKKKRFNFFFCQIKVNGEVEKYD